MSAGKPDHLSDLLYCGSWVDLDQKTVMRLFGICGHSRTTFPLTLKRSRAPYVVCLTCGKEFEYNWNLMRRGAELSECGGCR
jgi:hypothetical protein